MSRPDVGDLIDRLGQTAQECRALIREMHETEKSLRLAIREAREARKELQAAVELTLSDELMRYGDKVAEAAHAGYARVMTEFDRLAEPLYGALKMMDQLHEHQQRRAEMFKACECDAVTDDEPLCADGSTVTPAAGDFDICYRCLGFKVFTGVGRDTRRPTPAELAKAAASKQVVRTMMILMMHKERAG